ncbi:MAG TPA: hypothetical protein EYP49_13850 [Anaerolineae bacterium]|nr:hypothetical protein [Anaerolineae bacterium]
MNITIVSDASPLIYSAKMNKLEFLVRVVGTVAIPPAVYQEAVDAGQRHRRPDADHIAAAIKEQMIVRLELTAQEAHQLTSRLSTDPRLGAGECEVIACAAHRSLKALLHDKKARRAAAAQGVRTIQLADVLFLALLRRHVSLSEFKNLLHDLAILVGMDTATLLEREALAEEIAYQFKLQE